MLKSEDANTSTGTLVNAPFACSLAICLVFDFCKVFGFSTAISCFLLAFLGEGFLRIDFGTAGDFSVCRRAGDAVAGLAFAGDGAASASFRFVPVGGSVRFLGLPGFGTGEGVSNSGRRPRLGGVVTSKAVDATGGAALLDGATRSAARSKT